MNYPDWLREVTSQSEGPHATADSLTSSKIYGLIRLTNQRIWRSLMHTMQPGASPETHVLFLADKSWSDTWGDDRPPESIRESFQRVAWLPQGNTGGLVIDKSYCDCSLHWLVRERFLEADDGG